MRDAELGGVPVSAPAMQPLLLQDAALGAAVVHNARSFAWLWQPCAPGRRTREG